MNAAPRRRPDNDPVLLAEAALVILLLALFIFLYIVPIERRPGDLSWWSPVLLGAVALAVLVLDSWRRKRRHRRELRGMMDEHLGGDG